MSRTSPQATMPLINFPQIRAMPVQFNEAINFNTPELSARMAVVIQTSKLNDFKAGQRLKQPTSQSVASRNGFVSARTQQPSVLVDDMKNLKRHMQSFDLKAVQDSIQSGRGDVHDYQIPAALKSHRFASLKESTGFYAQQSTARDTVTNQFFSTDRYEFAGKKSGKEVIRVKNQQDSHQETVSSIGDPLSSTTQQWLKDGSSLAVAGAYQTQIITPRQSPKDIQAKVSTAHSVSIKSENARAGIDMQKGRPSLMSDSVTKHLIATRIPYRNSQLDHNIQTSVQKPQSKDFNVKFANELSQYSVSHKTPMSPNTRQKITMDRITHMTLKARGKLLPGQPTAQQFAEQLKKERAEFIPDQYGDDSPFVFNGTGKPVNSYRFNKFKELHTMRGIRFGKGQPDQELARHLKQKRSQAKHEKDIWQNKQRQGSNKMMHFKNNGAQLYSDDDRSRIDLQQSQRKTLGGPRATNKTDLTVDSDNDAKDAKDATETEPSHLSDANQQQLINQLQAHLTNDLINNSQVSAVRRRKYDLYGGKRNKEEFISSLSKQIKKDPPQVNISEIVDQFYHPIPTREGYLPESYKQVFAKTLEREKAAYFNASTTEDGTKLPVFHLTRDSQADNTTPMKRIVEEGFSDDKPERFFTLHHYNLQQLQKAYKAYKEARQGIVYAAKELKRYTKMKEGETIHISEEQVVAEIRQNPKLEPIAKIIEDPLTQALIRMLITYEKYNYQTEQDGIEQSMNIDGGLGLNRIDSDMVSVQDLPPFKEIELMKELVLEFGEAINERIKEDGGTPVAPQKDMPNSPAPAKDEEPLDSLSGRPLRKESKNNSYLSISQAVAQHPEFEVIKEEALQKVLKRVKEYKESNMDSNSSLGQFSPVPKFNLESPMRLGEISSPSFGSPTRSRLGSMAKNFNYQEPESPLIKKQKSISLPRRKKQTKRSKLTIQQFVQSKMFQGAFKELIETLDTSYKSRRDQNKQAAQHINKHVFYQLAKESITHNAAPNPNISYMNDCYEQHVMPFPLFSKIRDNMLKLVGYHLNEGYCVALEKFLTSQTAQETSIEKLILQGNSLNDDSFAAVLMGLLKNSKLQHLHYGSNELGSASNKVLAKLLSISYPHSLKSLVLSNMKTTGKPVKKDESAPEMVATDEEQDGEEEDPFTKKKVNIVQELTTNFLKTESLQKLVLQDVPLSDKSQKHILTFVKQNSKLENLQLINCQMIAEALAQICKELEQMTGLQSLSFRKNVLRNTKGTQEFATAMTELVSQAPAMMHLDISGMFIGDKNIEQILIEGVVESKTLAAVHFQDNQVTNWTRIRIYHALTGQSSNIQQSKLESDLMRSSVDITTPALPDQIPANVAIEKLGDQVNTDLKTSFIFNDFEEVNLPVNTHVSQSDLSMMEHRGGHILLNKRHKNDQPDRMLDSGKVDMDLAIRNINEMFKAQLPIIQFPESQQIIDEELLKERKQETQTIGAQHENVKGGIEEELRGTLYNRVSNDPSLYHDKGEYDKFFASSKWLSVSDQEGCWICNSSKILDTVNKKNRIYEHGQDNRRMSIQVGNQSP